MEQNNTSSSKCPSCGATVNKDTTFCSTCGSHIGNEQQSQPSQNKSESSAELYHALKDSVLLKMKNTPRRTIGLILFCIVAVAVIFTFYQAASGIQTYGNSISQISSVGGQTLEEAFYWELGLIFIMLAKCIRAFSWFLGAVLVWLGLNINGDGFSFFKK